MCFEVEDAKMLKIFDDFEDIEDTPFEPFHNIFQCLSVKKEKIRGNSSLLSKLSAGYAYWTTQDYIKTEKEDIFLWNS